MALAADRVFFGEIALSGAVRAVRHTPLRLKEASKLGFKAAVVPAAAEVGADREPLQRLAITHVRDLLDVLPPPAR